jgi:hypothetical protein
MTFVFDTSGTDRVLTVRVDAACQQGACDWFQHNLGTPVPGPRPMVPGETIDIDLND